MHIPMCNWCGEHEVGAISGGHVDFCSDDCADACASAQWDDYLDEHNPTSQDKDPMDLAIGEYARGEEWWNVGIS